MRETLFNWLRNDLAGARCLDLFAGSGALGFEALSRGAAHVTLVDDSRRCARTLIDNAARLDAGAAVQVICERADRVLQRHHAPWDLIFLDPPFRGRLLTATLDGIRATGALAGEGLIYVEAPRREHLPDADWRRVKHGTAGDTQFGLLATP